MMYTTPEATITEEAAALLKDRNMDRTSHLTGDDPRFGAMANVLTPLTSSADPAAPAVPRYMGNRHHRRLVSTETEISWLSNVSSLLRRGYSTVGSNGEQTKNKEGRFDHAWGILFDKHDAAFTNISLGLSYTLVILFSLMIFVGPFLLTYVIDKDDWCHSRLTQDQRNMFLQLQPLADGGDTVHNQRMLGGSGDFAATADHPYPNPDYDTDPCRYVRFPFLSYITMEECDFCQRLAMSVVLGGAIGIPPRALLLQLRTADRPAGIRTMGLVSLGSCFYTISSIMAFKSSTQTWDASRVTAALPAGVGFLGGALIWKGSVFVGNHEMHQVHGLTTAASVWLSAAVGVGVGGALYPLTVYVTTLVILILRFGPRIYLDIQPDDTEEGEEEEEHNDFTEDDQTQLDKDDDNADDADVSTAVASGARDHRAQSARLSLDEMRHRKLLAASIRKTMRNIPTFGS